MAVTVFPASVRYWRIDANDKQPYNSTSDAYTASHQLKEYVCAHRSSTVYIHRRSLCKCEVCAKRTRLPLPLVPPLVQTRVFALVTSDGDDDLCERFAHLNIKGYVYIKLNEVEFNIKRTHYNYRSNEYSIM